MNRVLPSLLLLSTTMFSACGGGDDDNPAAKYEGDWLSQCVKTGSSSSVQTQGNYVRIGNESLTFSGTTFRYGSTANCTGTANEDPYSGSFVIQGTKEWNGYQVDKVTVTLTSGGTTRTYKAIFLIKDGKFYGGIEGTTDKDGYPENIDDSSASVRV